MNDMNEELKLVEQRFFEVIQSLAKTFLVSYESALTINSRFNWHLVAYRFNNILIDAVLESNEIVPGQEALNGVLEQFVEMKHFEQMYQIASTNEHEVAKQKLEQYIWKAIVAKVEGNQ